MPAHNPPAEPNADAALAVLRACGAEHADPVRFRYLEALAQRAAAQRGAVQRVLLERLSLAAAAYAERVDAAAPKAELLRPAETAGALAGLTATLDRHAAQRGETDRTEPPTELRTARLFRSTWARLRIERQLARSQARVPANPGPLNSHRLVLRALRQMQDISPAYLARFMGHVEALMWLEQAGLAAAPARADAPAAPRPRRGGRTPGG